MNVDDYNEVDEGKIIPDYVISKIEGDSSTSTPIGRYYAIYSRHVAGMCVLLQLILSDPSRFDIWFPFSSEAGSFFRSRRRRRRRRSIVETFRLYLRGIPGILDATRDVDVGLVIITTV